MEKTKLSTRIRDAVRALRGEPWLPAVDITEISYTRPDILTIGAETSCPMAFIDL